MKQNKLGYNKAFDEVFKVRLQRKKIYGDNWKEMFDWELLAIIKMKIRRLEMFVINRKNEKLYENKKDTLIDLINYSLFLLENEIDKK